jgi:hypothetical protein
MSDLKEQVFDAIDCAGQLFAPALRRPAHPLGDLRPLATLGAQVRHRVLLLRQSPPILLPKLDLGPQINPTKFAVGSIAGFY